MRIPHPRRNRKRTKKLTLRVDILQAKELVMSDPRTCNMVAGIAFNGQSKRTSKVKRTANPIWNASYKLRLSNYGKGGSTLHIAVFDKHRKYNIYLGEVRISVDDLFHDKKTDKLRAKVSPTWYKLHSSKSENAFITGSIKLSFELLYKLDSDSDTIDTIERFKQWQSTLIKKDNSIKLNDQLYYSDTETDVESLIEEENASDSFIKTKQNSSTLLVPPSSDSNYSSDASDYLSTSQSTSALNLHRLNIRDTTKQQPIKGVVFIEIISASGLPPYKSFYQKGFDMDPFVVISFGKKTFRTSWRKHTLNPIFNQNLAFEVLSKEQTFDLVFNILDKDNISYHDKVAFGSIPMSEVLDKNHYVDYDLKLKLHREGLDYEPHLKLRVKFKDYTSLKNDLWFTILSKYCDYTNPDTLDIVQLTSFLEDSNIDEDLMNFFIINEKTADESLTINEIIKVLNNHKIILDRCPICEKRKRTDMPSHIAICSSKGNKLKSYATAGFASKRWYSKVLIKFAYGKYALGKNNANILVQDRLTGFILEEKMSLYIRLGIRLLYKGKAGIDKKRVKSTLKNLSIKQGAKFDQPSSVKDIDSFIKFHQLDLSECEDVEYKTFNEFFYRKLKPGSRSPESPDELIITSPADSRCTSFNNITKAKEIWIKGRQFTIKKLLGDSYDEKFEDCSVGIFRLAPQDYHRFHSPVDGVIGEPLYIQGEYYTVNPMAIRSDLDVFGENVRVVIPIETKEFGLVYFISVGAMMVGSTVLTVKKGQQVERTDELGYFKFGGSTIITLFQKNSMLFDSDLVANSNDCIETLVRVGMSVGHSPSIPEFSREHVSFDEKSDESKLKIIRTITGGNGEHPWEFYNLNVNSDDEICSDDEEDEEEDED